MQPANATMFFTKLAGRLHGLKSAPTSVRSVYLITENSRFLSKNPSISMQGISSPEEFLARLP